MSRRETRGNILLVAWATFCMLIAVVVLAGVASGSGGPKATSGPEHCERLLARGGLL
jgi:hypothetical protein